jgi:4-hydroxy-tetrahydrodipicolinate synthase
MASGDRDWKGVFVVTVTPFDEQGDIDETAFGALLDTFVEDGVDGVVVAGSTGEWYTMTDAERLRLFEIARERLAAPVKLIAGTAAIATRDAVALTAAAGDIGCDGAMVLAPPYAQPNEREVLAHFRDVAAVGLPLMVYNNPGRTQINLTATQLLRICENESVVALKESSKDLYQIAGTTRALRDRLAVFSGLEPYALPTLQRGAAGIVSMGTNILGRRAVDLYHHAAAGRWKEACAIEEELDQLYDAFYAGGYGAYVVIKECMRLVGRPAGWPRRPHLRVDAAGRDALAAVLGEIGASVVHTSAA